MDRLGKIIESITKPRYEEDVIDRLNYKVTSYILLAAAITIIAKEYGGKPIQCWLPAELASKRGWEQYAEDYCFVENTYFVPMHENLYDSIETERKQELTYYQWVPFMLMMQALMFTGPHVFWRMLNWMSGIQTRAVITMASTASKKNPSTKEVDDVIDAVAAHLDRAINAKHIHQRFTHSHPLVFMFRLFTNSYLSCVYVITKLLFIFNAYMQHVLLTAYLGSSGYDLTKSLMNQQSWERSGLFPRVTMCDFKVRAVGYRRQYTIQCVLMANMFNEKIFLGLWWWILILLTTTCVNFVYWLYVMNSASSKYNFIEGLITLGRPHSQLMQRRVQALADKLGGDGMLVLRLMVQNAGEIVTSMVVARVYDLFAISDKDTDKVFFTPQTPIPPLDMKKKPLDEATTPPMA